MGNGQRWKWRVHGAASGQIDDTTVSRPSLFEADPFRHVVFPNRIREQRIAHGHLKLMAFAGRLPDIPYIRLSKIERGEVFSRADELARIADAIGVQPGALLIDVEAAEFDFARWFAPFADTVAADVPAEANFAVMLAAAVRRRRALEAGLSAAEIDRRFGIAPVILSRIENAQKGLNRWSDDILAALCRLFDVADEGGLRRLVELQHDDGELDAFAAGIADPHARRMRTAQRTAAIAADLDRVRDLPLPRPRTGAVPMADSGAAPLRPRRVPVLGVPTDVPGGISLVAGERMVEVPTGAGARSYAVHVRRATLGLGLPGSATVIVDPDRYPQAGGLALVRDGEVHRLLAVLVGRDGTLVGCSTQPDVEIMIDALPPADVATVVAAHFV